MTGVTVHRPTVRRQSRCGDRSSTGRLTSPRVAADQLARVAALPGVSVAVAEARAAVDRLLAHRLLRRRSAEVSAECALRTARASAALEGTDVALEELRAAMAAIAPVPPVLAGALRVAAGLAGSTSTWERAPRQALARLHLLAVGATEVADLVGRPRGDTVAEDPLGLGVPPAPMEVAARLDGLAAALVAPSSAPALVVAAVVHGELLALRAFGTRDGVVARAAARLVLIGRGLDPKAVTAPEVGHVEDGGYATRARGYRDGDVAGWVVHCCAATALGAREGLAVVAALQRADG